MANWYLKGGSVYDNGDNCEIWFYLNLDGFAEEDYDSQSLGDIEKSDPFLLIHQNGTEASSDPVVEIGLHDHHRIKMDESGIWGWDEGLSGWRDLLAGAGAAHVRLHTVTSVLDHSAGTWKVLHSDGAGHIIELALGANGKYLKSTGVNTAPIWDDVPAGYTDEEAVAAVLAADDYLKLVGDTMGGAINMNSNNITGVNTIIPLAVASYDKYRLWTNPAYTIGLMDAMTYGGLNNYAMTFTVYHSVDRGWVWRDDNDAKNDGAMSLTTGGILTVKGASTFQSSLQVDGNITTGGTVDGVDIAARDHAATVAGDLDHNDLANIDAGDINHLTDVQVAALHALPALTDIDGGNWKIVYTDAAGNVIELPLGAANKFLRSNGAAAAPTWEDPTKEFHYIDKLARDGSLEDNIAADERYNMGIYMKETDVDASGMWIFKAPTWLPAGLTLTLHIEYYGFAVFTYSGLWSIQAAAIGEDILGIGYNILNGDNTHDLAVANVNDLYDETIGGLTGIVAGDQIRVLFHSDASNASAVVIQSMWFTWS